MTTYKERLKIEKEELDLKIKKLQQFIEANTIFTTLVIYEQSDMKNQLSAMREYSELLQRRLNRIEE